MASILIIDDEPGIRQTIASILEDEKYKVFSTADALAGLELLEKEAIKLVFLDVLLPKMGGMEALEKIRSGWPGIETVMISGHANIDMAVRAVKLGAFDFLEKPLSLDKILTVSRNALAMHKLREENISLKKKAAIAQKEIIGTSAAINDVREMIRQAAGSDARILISGENGVGKELVARAIHLGSSRAGRAFVELNCAAIPDTLIESELFGHEKGAFTDAVSSRKGRFEMADGGTLFLDEIGDMSLQAQSKVLRAIQEQKIEHLGSEKTIDIDTRIVAASNKDLEKACEEGSFRRDLFFRLNVIPIHIPALRERQEDIPLLLYHFLKTNVLQECELDEDALALLLSYEWPGNVRELQNLVERIAVMHQGNRIGRAALQNLLQKTPGASSRGESGKNGTHAGLPDEIMDLNFNGARECFEKYYLELHLSKNNGIISKTAQTIGIYPSNLHVKLKKHGLGQSNNKESV
jgi:two-component system nitrogen regulation response regulator NtrX